MCSTDTPKCVAMAAMVSPDWAIYRYGAAAVADSSGVGLVAIVGVGLAISGLGVAVDKSRASAVAEAMMFCEACSVSSRLPGVM